MRQFPHLANDFSGSQNTETTAKTTSKTSSNPSAWLKTNIESIQIHQIVHCYASNGQRLSGSRTILQARLPILTSAASTVARMRCSPTVFTSQVCAMEACKLERFLPHYKVQKIERMLMTLSIGLHFWYVGL